MKRILTIVFAAALLAQAALVLAQDSGEPSEQSVLDVARAKYQADQAAAQAAEQPAEQPADQAPSQAAVQPAEAPAPATASAQSQPAAFPYTPVMISFVPGLSVPFGTYDVSVAAGAIGSIVRDVSGAQASGHFNIARDINGAQAAGIFNLARKVNGIQAAGVFNMAESASGAQFAGVFDMAKAGATIQASGVFNIADGATELQTAGVFNIARDVQGFQGAGVFNIARDVKGVQAAGVVNTANDVKGVQIGVINVARNVDGAQIGLLNFAGNGIHSLGFAYQPATSYSYAFLQFGTPSLYTIAGLGVPVSDWSFDYSGSVASIGLGTRVKLLGIRIDMDLSSEQEIGSLPYGSFKSSGECGSESWEGWSMIKPYQSFRIAASLPLGHRLQAFAGLKVDIDIDALGDRVPEALKAGSGYKGSLFGGDFTVYPNWFFGLKLERRPR